MLEFQDYAGFLWRAVWQQIIVPVASFLTPKLPKKQVDDIFECYEEKVAITKKRSLEAN